MPAIDMAIWLCWGCRSVMTPTATIRPDLTTGFWSKAVTPDSPDSHQRAALLKPPSSKQQLSAPSRWVLLLMAPMALTDSMQRYLREFTSKTTSQFAGK
ncbi:unnamed protein product [Protopolystoma xenopodis]|uniref:Uncharacterized protein n=1 Tax=Protopolystoma xenopodis TaxID=117903 RepID=A0A3S5AUQ3_9PLAT|nr:unnamed protein product [Protopolystoma xenopodis]